MLSLTADNRLLPRIERARACLAARVRLDNGEPLPASLDLDDFERTLDNSSSDHYAMQSLQSRAHATGKITTAEAQTIYVALGNPPGANGWSESADLATKMVVTQVLAELAR